MIRIKAFFGCGDAPASSLIEARDLFEEFVARQHITREQIIAVTTCEAIWRNCLAHTVTLVYEDQKSEENKE
jgi:hypothetical protein